MSTGHSYDATNAAILREVPKAVQAVFPIVEGDNEIRVTNVTIGAADYSPLALNDHQDAREQGKSITVPVFADVELWRGGKRVQSRAKLKIGDLPLMTSLGSFMVGGNDYFVPFAQPRLKPGAYTREMNNGQYETFIPLVGGALSVWMDPTKGVLKVGHGDTNVSWYALVQAIGATDGQISQALGGDARAKELIEVNQIKNPEKDVEKFYISISRLKANKDLLKGGLIQQDERVNIPYADKVAAIKAWMESKSVDAFVTRKTMGTAISKVGIDLLLKAAHRILEVQRGAEDPDDRDAPEFKTYHGVEDLMSERIIKKARMITNKAKRKLADKDNSLADIFGTSWLNPLTVGYFGGAGGETGGLANTAEAANPLAILGERSKLTLQGEGGIQSTHAVTNSARLVRPTAANFVDLSHTPEGSSIGITTHAAWNAIRENKQLKSPFFAVRNGKVDRSKPIYLSIEEASDAVVGYPEYWDAEGKPTDKLVRANIDGEVAEVEPTRVQYMIPNGAAMFDHTSNAALFFHHTHSTRGMMAGKHISQALPLVHREEPLVKLMAPNQKQEVLEILAKSFTVRARVGGTVTKVTPNAIFVGTVKHELFDHYPMQAKVALHHDPVVKVGDVVKEGDLLADSNYSRNGRLALGVNLRSAYMPWRNATNYEDAVVISETAGKRLASLHMHRLDLEVDPTVLVDRNLFMAQFPTLLSSEKLAKLDESGVVKQGTKVSPGDIVITAVRKRVIDPYDKSAKNLGNIHKALERPYVNASVVWDEDFVGEVYRVIRRKDHIEIHIKTEEAMGVGDKISMGSAAKGTIAAIVPDDQMPHGKDGKPIEVIFNPHGVAGRINPSQTIEQAAGKLAVEGGERYAFTNFGGADHAAEIQAKLKAKGLTHGEMLFDPTEGRWLENPVATGYNYVFKLDHPVRKKFSARTREGYTLDEEPTRGKGKSGQSYDQLTEYALLGHNAHALLSESAGIRGTKNDDFWVAYQAGEVPPPPKVPFVFKKFQTFLHGMGIDTAQKGNTLHYLPMTDKRVREISKGAIQRASMLRSKDLAEEKGGLHDPTITGGLNGENYAHIELNRTLPHPLYEKVIRDVAGLKGADYYGLLGHTRHLDTKTGKLSDEPTASTVTGDAAFRHLLSFDIDQKLDETKAKLETAVGSDRNKYHRVTRYLRGLQTTGLTAPEAYLTSAALVIPPKYRPIIEMKNGGLRVADANLLYRDLLLARDTLDKAESGGDLPNSEMAKARLALYDTHAALIGVGKSLTDRRQDEEIKGFAEVIKGKNNKEGLFQRNLARRRNDYTGRSTIEPDATLGPDEIGIPKSMAWKIYSPMVVRRLVQQGWGPGDAVKELEKQTPAAEAALEAERVSRPVLYNRAPSLHRWNASTAMPRFVPGKEIKLSPLVLGPQNADFDGDQQVGLVFLSHPATMAVEGSPMAARFHTAFPALRDGHTLSMVDLENVPHGAVRGIKEGTNGRIAFFDAAPGLQVLAYDKTTCKMVWADVDGWSEHYDRLIEIVELSSGYQIITDDDPRAVYGRDVATLEEVRRTPTEAVGTVLVPRATRIEAPGELMAVDVPEAVRHAAVGGMAAWTLPSTLSLTHELGYLLGAVAGDGWVTSRTTRGAERKPVQVHLAGKDAEVFAAVERAMQLVFPGIQAATRTFSAEEEGRHGDCERQTYCSAQLARLIELWCDHGARQKHLPPFYLAANEEFRRGLFAGLMDTDGSLSVSNAKAKPQVIAGYTTINLRMAREVRLLAASLGIRGRLTTFAYKGQAEGAARDKQAWQVSFSTVDVVKWGGEGMRCARKTAKLAGVTCDPDSPAAAKADLVPLPPALAAELRPWLATTSSGYVICGDIVNGRRNSCVSRVTARKLIEEIGAGEIADRPMGATWLAIVANDAVTWDYVESVEKTGIRETGYDLTVPGYETFMAVDGVVLSNTMSVTVPVTEAARKEAFGLLASKNLFYDKDRSLAFGVDKDVITGLFMLTRQGVNSGKSYETKQAALRAYQDNKDGLKMNSLVTIKGQSAPQQIGWLILAELIPAQYLSRISPPFDGAKLNALLTSIAEKDPTSYNNMARVIAQAGFAASARSGGITSTIDELVMDRTKIKRLLDALEAKIGAAKTMADKRKVAVETFEAETKPGIHAALAEHLHSIGLGGSIFLTSKPSAKLGFDSYMQMLASPVLVKDAHDRVVPVVIRGGYGRGMSASDYMLTTPGARAGMVAKSLATAMPGFLSKEIAGNMGTTRITVADCGTQKGIEMAVAAPAGVKNYDADILDRHLLRDVPGTPFKRNDVITPSMLATMRDHKVGDVWVRSAMTCEADAPPCQMCAGRRPDGKLHPIGGNIGYDYGQTIGERSTQLVLKVFHSGGALGAGDSLFSGFARLRELLSAPEIVRNQGAVADHDGRVSNIRVAPQGGYYVTVTPDKAGDTEPEHYVPTGRTLKVKVGDHVHNGDALSDGAYRPQDIAAKKGTLAAQQYVVDESRKAFQEAGAVMRRPVLEVMAASMMRYVEITNDGGEKDLAVGDVMHENEYMKRKAKNAKIQAVPTLPGISHLPLARSNDMMERLNFQRLTDTMRDVPAMGGSSDLTGSKSPIPGLAYGATFRPVPIQHEDSAFNRLG